MLIGASTGGPQALEAILTALPADLPWPVLVAQHMPATFTSAFAQRLDRICALSVREVRQATVLRPGHVHIAQGDADMIVAQRPAGLIALPVPASQAHRWHPSVDRMVASALNHLPASRQVSVLLTGMGDDGATAMARLRAEGGHTIAQDEDTAVVWGMPGELVRRGGADHRRPPAGHRPAHRSGHLAEASADMPLIRRDPPAPGGDAPPSSSDLKSVDPDARRRAVRSLGHDRQAVPVLMAALEGESDPAVLEAIFSALEAIPDAALPLTSLLRSDDAGLRNDAVEALQAMPDAVRPLLPGLLADPDADVRILSVEVARCLPG